MVEVDCQLQCVQHITLNLKCDSLIASLFRFRFSCLISTMANDKLLPNGTFMERVCCQWLPHTSSLPIFVYIVARGSSPFLGIMNG